MAPQSWLAKTKAAIRRHTASSSSSKKTEIVGILCFEISGIMAKLIQLWRSLSNPQMARLRSHIIEEPGIRKLVSADTSFLIGLACAELVESLRLIVEAVSALSKRCSSHSGLQEFSINFSMFADSGCNNWNWLLSASEMERKVKKMNQFIESSSELLKLIVELGEAENNMKKQRIQLCAKGGLGSTSKVAIDLQQKIFLQRQQVKELKETSLWSCSLDVVVFIFAQCCSTVLVRIKSVFGAGMDCYLEPRRMSVSTVVYPSLEMPPLKTVVGRRSTSDAFELCSDRNGDSCVDGFFKINSMMLVPLESTLGAAALDLRYANIIKVLDKMIEMPGKVGADARDDLYSMLTDSVRGQLRQRLKGVGWGAAFDDGLDAEWRVALVRIMEWLLPMAHNTISWLAERSIERRSVVAPNVLLVQTLYFADRAKVEAAITELLVGLNYVWRFEREMIVARKFDCL